MRFRTSAGSDDSGNTATTKANASDSGDGNSSRRPEDERLPPQLLFTYGLQHILTMYAGAVAPALVIGGAADVSAIEQGILISGALLVAGIATLLQSVGHRSVGAQLPIVVACSFVPVSAAATIAETDGLQAVFGASLAGGIFALLLTPFFGQLIRFFPPVVTGTIITVIGLSLMPVAAGWIIDTDGADSAPLGNIALAGVTLALVLLFSRVLPGLLGRISILLGIVAGTVIAIPFGHTDFSTVGDGAIFSFGEPFHFGPPEFQVGAIITMCIIMLVVLTEGASHIIAVGEITGSRIDSKRISAGLRADVSLSIIGPIFNATPGSSFAQNIGLLALTKIKSRYVVAVGGLILITLGLFPVLGRVVSEIPMPVLGGAGLVLFGTVAASGIRTLGKVDFSDNLNVILVATSFGFGLIPLAVPDFYERFPEAIALVLHSGIVGAAVVAIVLNICFNIIGKGEYAESPSVFASAPTLDQEYPPEDADSSDGTGTEREPASDDAGRTAEQRSGVSGRD
ncbi:nucleobase:cation symporter-2 family protein [Lipingzhangella sp. LS1_29]|uniref:Nucleobase:cation symporter-2 family protein n=1 Tax=Lipingzhangella rawalii TaxID=2055835 RepID=A0ABU2H7A3_9ACTN|nr:nucleobase:cation symporter-2 family protein [Lipingzhangella rawalii]MDS1271197.1 nucleobase:cation symporter-2 family protein [Lipingzhangella rawalii]